MRAKPAILLVDDEIRSLEALERTLEDDFTLFTANGAAEALAILDSEFIQVVVSDQRMPDMSGVEFLKQVRERCPQVIRIILSGYTDNADIIAAVNEAGIYQYLLKPWRPESLLLTVQGAVELFRLQQENELLNVELKSSEPWLKVRVDSKREQMRERSAMDNIVRSPDSSMSKICALLSRVAPFDISVLIEGESGVGKGCWRVRCTMPAIAATAPSWWKTAPPCRNNCWKASCSATSAVPSPGPIRTASACFSKPMAAPFSWMKSAKPRLPSRPSCYACCKKAKSARWAVRVR
jgi:CheY-like chemotaxis protein